MYDVLKVVEWIKSMGLFRMKFARNSRFDIFCDLFFSTLRLEKNTYTEKKITIIF